MSLKINNIPRFRINECDRMKSERLDPNFIGSQFRINGEEVFGFFERINGNSPSIENKLTTNLNMAQDTQAIFEFVQNAVDAGSSDFFMYYDDDQFIALNNGASFNDDDILSILSVGASTKTSPKDEEMIGRFGVGFKLIHRMVGAQSGVDELINNYAGPIMFSWKNQEDLEELLQVESSDDLQLGDPQLNGEDPWLFKFLLTCFPMLPQKLDTEVRNLSYEKVLKAEKSLFDEQELHEFISFANRFWIARYDELKKSNLSTGSIFYLKLGQGKKDKLDEDFEHYRTGLNYSLRFIETLRKTDSLKNIYFNRHDPITSENVNLNVDVPIVIPHGSEDHELVSPLLEERDRGIDIKFRFAFETYPEEPDAEFGLIKDEPNFFKYFPIGKENHRLNFILHCNAFKIETSRREFQQDDELNSKLLSLFSKHFIQRLSKYREQNKHLYRDLFLSLLLSDDPGGDRDTNWIRDNLYNPLKDFCQNNVPVVNDKFVSADSVVVKATPIPIETSFLEEKIQWFYYKNEGVTGAQIAEQANNIFDIEIWRIGKIIQEMTAENFQSWYASLSETEKDQLKHELTDCLDGNLGINFWKNIQQVEGIHQVIKECENASPKKRYLLSFDRIELRAREIQAENRELISIFELALNFVEDKEFSKSFREQIVIIDKSGEEFPLTEIAQKDDIVFEFEDRKVTLRLSEILPNSFKKTSGVFGPVHEAFKQLDLDVDALFGIGSTRGKNLIYNEIEKPETEYTPEQLVFLLMYSHLEGTRKFKDVPASIIESTLDYIWKNDLFLPVKYQALVIGKSLSRSVYPNELALESEQLEEPVHNWLNSDGNSISSKLQFLQNQGLKTVHHPHIKLRDTLIRDLADSEHIELTKQFNEAIDLSNVFRFCSKNKIALSGPSKGIFQKLTIAAKMIPMGKTHVSLPLIRNVENDDTVISPVLRNSVDESESGFKIEKTYFEHDEKKPCTVDEMLNVLNENGKYLIDSRYIEASFIDDIEAIELTPGNDVDKAVKKQIRVTHRFIKEWESRSDHRIYLFKDRVPRCIRYQDYIFRRYEGGFFHYDRSTKTFFIGGVTTTEEVELYNYILQLFEKNRSVSDTIENVYREFEKADPEKLRKSKSDSNYYKQLTRDSEPFTGEWLENSLLWEKARKEENFYKSRKLRFNDVSITPAGEITLSKYQYDTLPVFLEAFENFENIQLYSEESTESISISAAFVKMNDFDLQLQLEKGANLHEVISLCRDNSVRAVIKLPKEDPWLKKLHSALFVNDLIRHEEFLRERIADEWGSSDIRLIFGPPGTGKTTNSAFYTLYELALAKREERKAGILVLTPTNKAADVFIEKCFEFINNPDFIFQIDVGLSEEKKGVLFEFLSDEQTINKVFRYGRTNNIHIPAFQTGYNVPSENQIVVATTIHRYVFNQAVNEFPSLFTDGSCKVIIDEASMVPLSYALYVLLTINSEQKLLEKHEILSKITIAGDPFQIQPVGLSPHPGEIRNYKGWTTESLYTLLQLNKFNRETTPVGNYFVDNLNTQFRSNAEIGELYSSYLYGGLLNHNFEELPGDLDKQFPKSIHYVKFEVHDFDDDQKSLTKLYKYRTYPTYHLYSCVLAVELAAKITSLSSESILILSPYGIQARILKDLIESDQNRFGNKDISISTIHGAQGDQADHVILVQNPSKISNSGVTFFNNPNLINVAISRAKKKLFVLAPDPSMIKNTKELNDKVLTFNHPVVTFGKYEFESDYFGDKDSIKSMIGVRHFSDFIIEDVATANFGNNKYQFYTGDGKVFCWFNSGTIQ